MTMFISKNCVVLTETTNLPKTSENKNDLFIMCIETDISIRDMFFCNNYCFIAKYVIICKYINVIIIIKKLKGKYLRKRKKWFLGNNITHTVLVGEILQNCLHLNTTSVFYVKKINLLEIKPKGQAKILFYKLL